MARAQGEARARGMSGGCQALRRAVVAFAVTMAIALPVGTMSVSEGLPPAFWTGSPQAIPQHLRAIASMALKVLRHEGSMPVVLADAVLSWLPADVKAPINPLLEGGDVQLVPELRVATKRGVDWQRGGERQQGGAIEPGPMARGGDGGGLKLPSFPGGDRGPEHRGGEDREGARAEVGGSPFVFPMITKWRASLPPLPDDLAALWASPSAGALGAGGLVESPWPGVPLTDAPLSDSPEREERGRWGQLMFGPTRLTFSSMARVKRPWLSLGEHGNTAGKQHTAEPEPAQSPEEVTEPSEPKGEISQAEPSRPATGPSAMGRVRRVRSGWSILLMDRSFRLLLLPDGTLVLPKPDGSR